MVFTLALLYFTLQPLPHNEEKSVVAENVIRTLKNKIYKHGTYKFTNSKECAY